MPGKPQYTVKHMVRALTECKGLVSYAAKRLGCSVRTVENYCTRYAAVRQARDDARGEMLDVAESQLMTAVERGEMWAILFALRTLGRSRGYVERHEVTGQGGGPIVHASIHLWEERLQEAHRRLQAEREAVRVQRALEAASNGHAVDPTGSPD